MYIDWKYFCGVFNKMVKRVKDYEFLIYLFIKGLKEMEIKIKFKLYVYIL